MRKILILAAMALTCVAGATAVLALADDGGSGPELRERSSIVDVSGPCDEAEHINDPRCTGVTTATSSVGRLDDDGSHPGDISGPCDEAEHINDPRCTGTAPIAGDSSGPGPGVDDDDSSGPGSGDDEDSSGHGGGDDDGRSGHGGGDDEDDDSSGHGGDDD